MHDVVAREIVPAMFESIDHGLRHIVAGDGEDVAGIAIRIVALHKSEIVLHALVIGPNLIAWVLYGT